MSASPDIAPDTKGRILDAAAEAFMLRGFADTTVDDIAEAVGATKGLIYYHFKTKFDIFLAAYELGMKQVREQVEPYANGPGTGRERLELMSIAHLMNLMEQLEYHQVVHQGVRNQESAALKTRQRDALIQLNDLRRDYESLFRRVIGEGVDDGSLRSIDVPLAARMLLSSLNSVDAWYRKDQKHSEADTRHLAEAIVDLITTGMAATK